MGNIINEKIDYKAIVEASPDLYLVLTPTFFIVNASDTYLKSTLINRKDVIGKYIFDVFPENPADTYSKGITHLKTSLERVLNNKKPDTMAIQKYDIPKPEGGFEERYWSPVNCPVFDRDQNLIYIIHRVEDVTSYIILKKTQQEKNEIMEDLRNRTGQMEIEIYRRAQEIQRVNHELLEKEKQFDLALQASKTGRWHWDVAKDQIVVDDHMAHLFGFKDKSHFPKKYEDFLLLLHSDDKMQVDSKVKDTLRNSSSYNVEYRTIWPDKTEHVINARGLVFLGEGNTPVEMAGVCMDITEKVNTQNLLEQLATTLSINNKKLKDSNEQLQQFAYVASHDLQEPLRMVKSYLQIIKNRYGQNLDKEGIEFMNFAMDGADRMKALINDLLQYSRIDTQGNPFKHFSLQDSLVWAISNLESAIKESNAKIEIVNKQFPIINGDFIQIGQLFQNLINNSLRYCKKSTAPHITISVEEEANEWRIAVSDKGIGIDPKYHQRIFKIFQRLHTNLEYPGTGIGLALCQKIVERHNGKIWLESEPDKGTTFYFTLPK